MGEWIEETQDPAWAEDLAWDIACYLWGISALRNGLTMPGEFRSCVSAALRAGLASGQIRLPASAPQVPHYRLDGGEALYEPPEVT